MSIPNALFHLEPISSQCSVSSRCSIVISFSHPSAQCSINAPYPITHQVSMLRLATHQLPTTHQLPMLQSSIMNPPCLNVTSQSRAIAVTCHQCHVPSLSRAILPPVVSKCQLAVNVLSQSPSTPALLLVTLTAVTSIPVPCCPSHLQPLSCLVLVTIDMTAVARDWRSDVTAVSCE